MKNLETETIINASAQVVWEILMDFENYPNWNPFIQQISGNAGTGNMLNVTIHPEGQKPMTFTPEVLVNKHANEFRWIGKLFIKGLFDGEHYFQLEPISSDQTRFIHGENFSGVMAGVLLKMIGENTLTGFQQMNQALKNQAELIHA